MAGVILHEGHVLLSGDPRIPIWVLPGGGIEMLEASEAALRRELREELGAEVRIERLLWVVEHFFERDGDAYHEIGFYFRVIPLDAPHLFDLERTFDTADNDVGPIPTILRWFRLDDIEGLPLYPEFLKTSLRSLSQTTQHMVHSESASLTDRAR